jgi:D-glycero-alpha-D-manno-heptose 1-phosphate guanylyltransferase
VKLSADQVTAVILAGGFGTRIRHLLSEVPKPMAPVHGKPFVEWVVRYLAKQGIRSVVLSTGHLSETLERHFQNQPVPGVAVQCVPETTPLGTAGGFLNAVSGAAKQSAAWLVVNGDSLVLAPLEPVIASLNEPEVSGAIVGVPMPDASRYGTVEQDIAGDLTSFREKRSGAGVINAGVYLFRASALEGFRRGVPLSFEKEVFPDLITRKVRIKVCAVNASFLDIGTPESLPLATAFIQEHRESFEV